MSLKLNIDNDKIDLLRFKIDLQYGVPTAVNYLGNSYIFFAFERISQDVWNNIAGREDIVLFLAKNRTHFLYAKLFDAKINCMKLSYVDVHELVFSPSKKDNVVVYEPANKFAQEILKIAQNAEIIPALIMIERKNIEFPFHINTIDFESISQISEKSEVLERVVATNVILNNNVKAQINVFRNQFAKDHYAVIIGSIKNPVLRIHSSCFTGDLLYSLQCDCYDQLQSAVPIMAKAGGGILIYLNQEGRGIGLTNKLRAYKLQTKGFDTFEADASLGFEHDSRNFDVALSILTSIGVSSVRLLSNNRKKASFLEENGIKVTELISHQFFRKEIKNYYKAKAEKMNHNIKTD